MSDTEARVRGAFRSQGKSCALLGSPFMGRLMPLIAERLTTGTEVGARILGWEGDVGPAGQSVPLRTAGALHALVLDGTDKGLAAAYPPATVDDDTLWAAVQGAVDHHGARIMAALDRAPQTNEVRRSAILLPALWWLLAKVGDMPVALSELGASAGLNLMLDRFSIETPEGLVGPAKSPVHLRPEWRGPPPPARPLRVVDRAGVDRHPIDATNPDDALRLLSYLWPDQPERMALTCGAIALGPKRPDEGRCRAVAGKPPRRARTGTASRRLHDHRVAVLPSADAGNLHAQTGAGGRPARPRKARLRISPSRRTDGATARP